MFLDCGRTKQYANYTEMPLGWDLGIRDLLAAEVTAPFWINGTFYCSVTDQMSAECIEADIFKQPSLQSS